MSHYIIKEYFYGLINKMRIQGKKAFLIDNLSMYGATAKVLEEAGSYQYQSYVVASKCYLSTNLLTKAFFKTRSLMSRSNSSCL